MNKVIYRQIPLNPGQEPKWEIGPCFIRVKWKQIKELHYLCPIHESLHEGHLTFWYDFIRSFLAGRPESLKYTYKKISFQKRPHILWELKGPLSLVDRKNLLYVTAFRYLDEQPCIVRQLYQDQYKANRHPDALFKLFQQMQLDVVYRMGDYANTKLNVDLIHGLVFPDVAYLESPTKELPISLEQFWANYANLKIATVQGHFRDPSIVRTLMPARRIEDFDGLGRFGMGWD